MLKRHHLLEHRAVRFLQGLVEFMLNIQYRRECLHSHSFLDGQQAGPPVNQFAPPDAGGAMSLGGETDVLESSFLSNSASSRGLAIAVVGSANLTDLAFDGNELYCGVHSFREDTEQVRRKCGQIAVN